MPALTIRNAQRGDIASIVTWNAAMAMETEDKKLDQTVLTRGVTAVLDDARRGVYLIAELEGRAVGCLMITTEWSDWRNGDFWWIQSVYVTPEARRFGVFRALYADVMERARNSGVVGLRLYVETENTRAQHTYEGLGMARCHYAMYEQML